MCLGLCSGRITIQFRKKVREIGPCSVYDFAGSEAANREMYLSYSSRQRDGKKRKDREFLACLEKTHREQE